MDIDTSKLLELSIGLGAAALVLKIIFDFLKPVLDKFLGSDKKEPSIARQVESCCEILQGMRHKVDELHSWHNVRNADGVPVWYVPSALEKAIQALAANINEQTAVLRGVAEIQKDTCAFMDRLERSLSRSKEAQ